MNIELSCKNVSTSAYGSSMISASLDHVDESELMDLLTIDQVIKHFGESDLLDAIGEKECKDHFDLV